MKKVWNEIKSWLAVVYVTIFLIWPVWAMWYIYTEYLPHNWATKTLSAISVLGVYLAYTIVGSDLSEKRKEAEKDQNSQS